MKSQRDENGREQVEEVELTVEYSGAKSERLVWTRSFKVF